MLSSGVSLTIPGALPLGNTTGGGTGGGGGSGGGGNTGGSISYTGDYGKPGVDVGFTNVDGALSSVEMVPFDPSFYWVESTIDATPYNYVVRGQSTWTNTIPAARRMSRLAATTNNGMLFAFIATKYAKSTKTPVGVYLHMLEMNRTSNTYERKGSIDLRDLIPQGPNIFGLNITIDGYFDDKLFLSFRDGGGNTMCVTVNVTGTATSKQYLGYTMLANGLNNLTSNTPNGGSTAYRARIYGQKFVYTEAEVVKNPISGATYYQTNLKSVNLVASVTSSFADSGGAPIFGSTTAATTLHGAAYYSSSPYYFGQFLPMADYHFNGEVYMMRATIPKKFGGTLDSKDGNGAIGYNWGPRVALAAQPTNFALPMSGQVPTLKLTNTYGNEETLWTSNLDTPGIADTANPTVTGTNLFNRKRYYLTGTPWESFTAGSSWGYAEVPWVTTVAEKYTHGWLFAGNTNTEIYAVNGTIAGGYVAKRVLQWDANTETYTACSQDPNKSQYSVVKAFDFSITLGKAFPLTQRLQWFSQDYSCWLSELNRLLIIDGQAKKAIPLDVGARVRAAEPLWLNDATGISNPALAKVLQYKQQTSRNEIMAYRQAGNKIAVMHGNPVFMASDDMQEFLTSVHVTLYNKPTA